jgi:HAE1 family hydrophobic/amphiphilic exporter-1
MHTRAALRRPVTTIMIFLAVALVGLVGARLLPLEQFPDVTFPFMGVTIPYPGSTPEEIEELITRPVEDALATLAGIKEIKSQSKDASSELQIEFNWGTDVQAASFEVRSKLDSIRAQLPRAANRILMFTASSADQPVLTVRLSAAQDLSTQYEILERYLKKPIERLDGVARVDLAGVEPREVRILVDAGRIAAHAIDIQRLVTVLERSNFSVSAGQLTDRGQRFSVRPIGELTSLDQLRELVISGDVRLKDLADVELISPELTLRRNLDGRPAVGIDVFKSTQANVVDTVARVLKVVENARTLPQLQGISIFVIDNQAKAIKDSLSDVGESGLIGALLAVCVLYLFLRHWPTTLIVSLAVPVSLLATLAVMFFVGLSINVMSMMGMMLAVGMLVDNAVVVTESVYRYRQLQPDQPQQATLLGVSEVGVATLAGTATSVVVFLPIVFGDRNQATIFLTHVAIPICVAMIASLLVAQSLIPMLTSRFPAPPPPTAGSVMERIRERYDRALRWMLARGRRPAAIFGGIVLATVALLVASNVWQGKLLKIDMFPQDAGRQVVLPYNLQGSYPIERVAAAVQTMERYFEKNRERFDIDSIYSRYSSDDAITLLVLKPKQQAHLKAGSVIELAQSELPEIIIGKPSFSFDQQGASQGFNLQISGESTEKLARVADEVARTLASVPGLDTIRSEARDGDEEVQIVVDRARAAALGLNPQQVALSVAAALRGDSLREFRGADRELTMRLAFRSSDKQNVEDLARLPVYLPGGQRITLSSVATFNVERGARSINRINRLTAVTLSGTLQKDATLPVVKDRIKAVLDNYQLPPGYSWKFGRGVDQDDDTQKMMVINLLLALVLIYLVMAAMFESTLLPMSVISSIFLAIIGVLWTLFITRTTLTFMALIGIQILMGVVVNIGIVLVAHINDLRQSGMNRLEAIAQGCCDRLRPILMTTLTTVLGLLPLAVGDSQLAVGTAGPSYAPMALAIMGGLAFGALTSLFAVPVLYVWLDDLVAATGNMLRRASTDVLGPVDTN